MVATGTSAPQISQRAIINQQLGLSLADKTINGQAPSASNRRCPLLTMNRLIHKIARTLTVAKAPLNAMLCSILVLGLVMMSSAWCCCLLGMPDAATSTSAASMQTTQPVAMLLTSGDHSCCLRPAKDTTSSNLPVSSAAPAAPDAPHGSSSCQCQGQILDAPDQHLTIHNIASSAASQSMFLLPRLTAAWQLPAVTPLRMISHDTAPPKPAESSLLAQACLLTV